MGVDDEQAIGIERESMSPVFNLPNQITLARLGLAVAFFTLLSQYSARDADEQLWLIAAASAVYIVAAVSDILDGYLARKYGQVTALGRVLDPLVDKVLVCGAFILFVGPGFVNAQGESITQVKAWMVVVIVGRELLVTGLRGFNESTGRAFGASISGKVKMWTQSIAVPAILILIALGDQWPSESSATMIKQTLAWLTVVITILSMVQYLVRSRHILDASTPS